MLYIGHSTFDEIGTGQEIRHGYFSTVVDADNIERAVTEFKELIFSMKKMKTRFNELLPCTWRISLSSNSCRQKRS